MGSYFEITHITQKKYRVSPHDGTRFDGNILLKDTCIGNTINESIWDIYNPDADVAAFALEGGEIRLKSLTGGPTTSFYRNFIATKLGFENGIWRFSSNQIIPINTAGYIWYGLRNFAAGNNVDIFQKSGTVKLSYRVMVGNVVVYQVDNITADFLIVKFVIDSSGISAYRWSGLSWSQIGVTQNLDLGELKLFAAVRGGVLMEGSIRDIYITDKDYATSKPE